MPFGEAEKQSRRHATIPFRYRDYLQLVDRYGRARHAEKRGAIAQKQIPLLTKLGLSDWQWALLSKEIEKEASTMLHGLEKLEILERQAGKASAIVA